MTEIVEIMREGSALSRAVSFSYFISQGSNSAGSVHLPGSYPHDQWQGSRIEGFVISQGQQITKESIEVG